MSVTPTNQSPGSMSDDEEEVGFFDFFQQLMVDSTFPASTTRGRALDRIRGQIRQSKADFQRVRTNFDPQVEKMRQRALKQFDEIDKAFSKAVESNTTEKVWYTVMLFNLVGIGMVVAAWPHLMHIVYTAELLFLLPIRFWDYHNRHWHYFLADLCYYVNGLLLLFIWVFPGWSSLWMSCFALSYGSLSASVILWRNSLVLQSIDKTTSSFIHLMPPLVLYCIHFRLDPEYRVERFPGANMIDRWDVVRGVLITTISYFVWQLAYHYFITVRKAEKIKNGNVTSFEFMRHRYAKSKLGKFVNNLPGPLPVIAFTLIQFTFQLVTMIPCPLYYNHELLSTVHLLVIFAVAAYNGASYYVEVYGERFHKELQHLQTEIAKLEDTKETEALKRASSAESLSRGQMGSAQNVERAAQNASKQSAKVTTKKSAKTKQE